MHDTILRHLGASKHHFCGLFSLFLCSFTDLLTFLGGSVSLKNIRSSSTILLFSFFSWGFFCRMSAAKYNAARTSSLLESLKRHSIQHKKYKTAEMVSITKWKFNTYPPYFCSKIRKKVQFWEKVSIKVYFSLCGHRRNLWLTSLKIIITCYKNFF